MNQLFWSPQTPIVLLVGALLLIVFFEARTFIATGRRRGEQLAKSAAAISLLIILLGPMFADTTHEQSKYRLVILVDTSQSMALLDADSSGSMTRLDELRSGWLSAGARDAYQKMFSTSYALVSDENRSISASQAVDTSPVGNTTPLADSLLRAINKAGFNGRILALTDGIDTEENEKTFRSVAALAAARNVRIDVAIAGSNTPPPALRLRAWADPAVVYQGEPSTLHVEIIAVGMDDAEAYLTVYEGGTTDGAIVFHRRVKLDMLRDLAIPVTPQRGSSGSAQAYTVAIKPTIAEPDFPVRTRQVFIEVLDEPVRVVLFDAEPYWETTFFIDALRNDPQIELTTVIALAPEREMVRRYSPRLPGHDERLNAVDLDNLGEFDVVVLGKGVERWFDADAAQKLQRFVVEDGGVLVLLRGDPVATKTTDSSELHRVVQRLYPAGYGSVDGFQTSGEKDASPAPMRFEFVPEITTTRRTDGLPGWFLSLRNTIGGTDAKPVIAVGSVGSGTTVVSLIDGMWRWAMSPNDSTRSRSLYGRLWAMLVRRLAMGGEFTPGRALSVRFGIGQHMPGEPVEIILRSRRELPAFGPSAVLRTPDGVEHDLAFTRPDDTKLKWRAMYTPTDEGVYELRAYVPDDEQAPVTARFAVYENRRELLETKPRREQMLRLAQATGGNVWAVTDADQYLREIRHKTGSTASSVEYEPAWDEPWVFVLILGMLGFSWLLAPMRGNE